MYVLRSRTFRLLVCMVEILGCYRSKGCMFLMAQIIMVRWNLTLGLVLFLTFAHYNLHIQSVTKSPHNRDDQCSGLS